MSQYFCDVGILGMPLVECTLTLSAHAREGYSSYVFCVSVCYKLILKMASFYHQSTAGDCLNVLNVALFETNSEK